VRRELETEILQINVVLDEAFRVLADDRLRTSYREHLVD
jgi:hypothetical protein